MHRALPSGRLLALVFCWLFTSSAHGQGIIYVDQNAPGPVHDGTSWRDAFTELSDALAIAISSNTIRIADGTYTPDAAGLIDPREATFLLVNGVTIEGGYAGFGAADPDERNMIKYESILSGDLDQNDGPNLANNDQNSYHVVTSLDLNRTAILGGVTIAAGNANGVEPHLRGGGILNTNASPTIRSCTLRDNFATLGGGMNIDNGSPLIIDSVFTANSAGFAGGAIRGWQNSAIISNCLFSENLADSGGAFWTGASNLRIQNCTFADNVANTGSALAFDSCCPQQPSTFTATNCILFDGGDEIHNEDGSTITIMYSAVQEGWDGIQNISDDPLFVPGPSGLFYLASTDSGQLSQSPGVDGGNNTADNLWLDAKTTRSDELGDIGQVDMGYHYPITGQPLLPGDFDRSGGLDLRDVAGLQRCFTGDEPTDLSPQCRILDFTPDGYVDLIDAQVFTFLLDQP